MHHSMHGPYGNSHSIATQYCDAQNYYLIIDQQNPLEYIVDNAVQTYKITLSAAGRFS